MHEDATEREQIEQALRQSEELYRSVLEQAGENIFLVDVETRRILEANAALQTSLGYTLEELRRMLLYDIVAAERQSIDANIRRVIEKGRYYLGERKYRRKDGSLAAVEVSASAISYGRTKAMCIVAHDITERKRIEEALKESEEWLRLAVESTGVGTWDYNPITGYLKCDECCKAVFGLQSEAQVDYKVFLEGLHPEDREWVDQVVQSTLEPASGGKYNIEYRTVGIEDGVERWVASRGQAFFDEAGKVVRLIGTMLDITERKRDEEALREIREQERSRIAREMHDQVLSDLVYALQEIEIQKLLLGDDEQTAGLEKAAEAMRRSVEGVRRAIYDLRLEMTAQGSIISALENLLDLNRRLARGRYEVELIVEEGFPSTLPGEAGIELVKIIQEALNNARRHSQAKEVRVVLWSEEDTLWAEVKDDGRGFELDSVKRGLGMFSMRERAEALDGGVEVESQSGKGTKVRVYIPLAPPA